MAPLIQDEKGCAKIGREVGVRGGGWKGNKEEVGWGNRQENCDTDTNIAEEEEGTYLPTVFIRYLCTYIV